MSDTDSFIEEVTEEVRRDRLFGMFRRYGWIAGAAVVVIVGGAAWNEWQKAERVSAAQDTGDAIFEAIENPDDAARVAALEALQPNSPEAQVLVDYLVASHQLSEGDNAGAAATLKAVSETGTDVPEVYRQIALYKSLIANGAETPAAERRSLLDALAAPGAPLSLLAQEQLALLDIEEGNPDAAIDRLNAIIADAGVTGGLRNRASQLIVALGGVPGTANQ
ncbi:hypothetical protein NNA36_18195 [Shimia sp. CNT1-13L.2]|uniref:DUF2659 family protein n=1 Tax=Shimia sp. CNT1-13L.2 TaxID=2959663 RepID=UPI0020CE1101|nr:hypothetical protein [Shimia sp. CNT1-13L.2]